MRVYIFLCRLDICVFNMHQDLSSKLQRSIGVTNFDMARLCLLLFTAIILMPIMDMIARFGPLWFLVLLIAGQFVVCAFFLKKCADVEKQYTNNACAMRNILLITYMPIRITAWLIFGTLSVILIMESILFLSISEMMIASGFLFFISYFYFVSCTPLPPAMSTMRQWMQKNLNKKISVPYSDPNSA